MDVSDKLRELDMTSEEVDRFAKAFKDEKFREMLREYAEEISDPENKKKYEEEMTLLEQGRGNHVEFIHPEPFRALRTSVNGKQKCFINICSNEKVAKPQCAPGQSDGRRGQRWSLPHSLHPGRQHRDKKGVKHMVYDVVFHPDTLHIAGKNSRFMDMVKNTATQGIQDAFKVTLDSKNVKELKVKYKGTPQPCIIRKPIPGYEAKESSEKAFSFPYPDQKPKPDVPQKFQIKPQTTNEPTKPNYTIKYRSYVDMQDYTCSRDSTGRTRPKEIEVTIDLPLLKTASDTNLDVKEKMLLLECEKPAYRLELPLSFPVDGDKGEAKFNKHKGQLTVTLPVLPAPVVKNVLSFDGDDETKVSEDSKKEQDHDEVKELDNRSEQEREIIAAEDMSENTEDSRNKENVDNKKENDGHMNEVDTNKEMVNMEVEDTMKERGTMVELDTMAVKNMEVEDTMKERGTMVELDTMAVKNMEVEDTMKERGTMVELDTMAVKNMEVEDTMKERGTMVELDTMAVKNMEVEDTMKERGTMVELDTMAVKNMEVEDTMKERGTMVELDTMAVKNMEVVGTMKERGTMVELDTMAVKNMEVEDTMKERGTMVELDTMAVKNMEVEDTMKERGTMVELDTMAVNTLRVKEMDFGEDFIQKQENMNEMDNRSEKILEEVEDGEEQNTNREDFTDLKNGIADKQSRFVEVNASKELEEQKKDMKEEEEKLVEPDNSLEQAGEMATDQQVQRQNEMSRQPSEEIKSVEAQKGNSIYHIDNESSEEDCGLKKIRRLTEEGPECGAEEKKVQEQNQQNVEEPSRPTSHIGPLINDENQKTNQIQHLRFEDEGQHLDSSLEPHIENPKENSQAQTEDLNSHMHLMEEEICEAPQAAEAAQDKVTIGSVKDDGVDEDDLPAEQVSKPPPVILREISKDRKETIICDHSTSAGFTFQNSLLYELD